MLTAEYPQLFWTSTGKLYTQTWGDSSTRQELAADVAAKPIGALRGWHNDKDGAASDQGVLIAYIKTDGKVYYRALTGSDGAKSWETERSLEAASTGCLGVRLAITIDYRMVFVVTYASGVKAYVSVRNWSGFASPAEHISARVRDVLVELSPLEYFERGATEKIQADVTEIVCRLCPRFDPSVVAVIDRRRVGAAVLELDFTHPVRLENAAGIQATIPTGSVALASIAAEGRTLRLTAADPIGAVYSVTITIAAGALVHPTSAQCAEPLPGYALTLDGTPEITRGYSTERITAAAAVSLVLTAVAYRSGVTTERITAEITPELVLTRVGVSPL